MNLREQARADLSFTLKDDVNGFGRAVVLIDPDGQQIELVGQTGDIGLVIDPDTGTAISGRTAHISIGVDDINAAITAGQISGFPRGISDETSKPWICRFDDLEGATYTFKLINTFPDRTLGLLTCLIGAYRGAI